MHESVIQFAEQHISREDVAGKRVLEVGSYNVNGSLRPIVEALGPALYLGSDMRPGPGVDVVVDIASDHDLGTFDLVCCAGTLEHMEDWRGCIRGMRRRLTPDGILILTTVSPGFPLHDFPSDYWRFTLADMTSIFSDMQILVLKPDPQVPGVFLKAKGGPSTSDDLDQIQVTPI